MTAATGREGHGMRDKILLHAPRIRMAWARGQTIGGARDRRAAKPDDRRDRARAPRRSRCFESRRSLLCAEVRGARRALTAKCGREGSGWGSFGMRPLLKPPIRIPVDSAAQTRISGIM
jgi:hypothetical protein